MSGFLLHLYGPMQSWGDTGFGQLRGAGEFPSRSAVLGIIAAAQGIPRADARLLALHEIFRVHLATTRPGRVRRDFHTVETREGSPRTLTSRDYHHDAHFVALIETEDKEALRVAEKALSRPVFAGFLGRRSCPPCVPLIPEKAPNADFQDLRDVAVATGNAFPRMAGSAERRWGWPSKTLTIWLDGHFNQSEIPASFADANVPTYGSRRARLVGVRRAFVASPFTRLSISNTEPAEVDSPHQSFFDAAP